MRQFRAKWKTRDCKNDRSNSSIGKTGLIITLTTVEIAVPHLLVRPAILPSPPSTLPAIATEAVGGNLSSNAMRSTC